MKTQEYIPLREEPITPKKGNLVKIPLNLTTDPYNKRGFTGKVITVNEQELIVRFNDGTSGRYAIDSVEIIDTLSPEK
jgi:hypothetical protein